MVDISLNDLSHKAQGDFQTNLNEGLSQDEALQNTIDNITNQLVDLNLSSEFITLTIVPTFPILFILDIL